MNLIHTKTGYVVATTNGAKVIVHDPILHRELTLKGIAIPLLKQNSYHGKKVIYFDDPLFSRAFLDIYLKKDIDRLEFSWKKN